MPRTKRYTQSALLREVLATLKEPYDRKEVLRLVNELITKLPLAQKPKSGLLTAHRVSSYLSPYQKRNYASQEAPMKPIAPSQNGEDIFTVTQLTALGTFLRAVGQNNAQRLMKLASNLFS